MTVHGPHECARYEQPHPHLNPRLPPDAAPLMARLPPPRHDTRVLKLETMSATPAEQTSGDTGDWEPDLLGPGYTHRTLDLGQDPEGEGRAIATVVRHLPAGTDQADWRQRPAVLLVHGMTDYFFSTHVAEYLHEAGMAVYAVDLRKCGRSRRHGQRWHYSENLQHYFPDLSSALDLITAVHPTVIPNGHSTGGLILPLWLDHLRRSDPVRHARVGGLILNSPWLDMMYPRLVVRLARPVLNLLGRRFGWIPLPGGNLGAYGKSIHREWDFDTAYKPVEGFPKYLAWVRAVLEGQKQIHDGGVDVSVPVLTLCSTKSWLNRPYTAATDTADAVLDVEQIQRRAPVLGNDVTVAPIEGARHDVYLSMQHAREEALQTTVEWLHGHLPPGASGDVSPTGQF